LAPDLLRGLHLARHLVGPVVRNVAVRAGRAHARAVAVVDRGLQLLEDVGLHLVATGAEGLGVGGLQRGVEPAPEHDARDEAAQGQEAQAQVPGRTVEPAPEARGGGAHPMPGPHCARSERSTSSMSLKPLATSGRASVWVTWHWTQK